MCLVYTIKMVVLGLSQITMVYANPGFVILKAYCMEVTLGKFAMFKLWFKDIAIEQTISKSHTAVSVLDTGDIQEFFLKLK